MSAAIAEGWLEPVGHVADRGEGPPRSVLARRERAAVRARSIGRRRFVTAASSNGRELAMTSTRDLRNSARRRDGSAPTTAVVPSSRRNLPCVATERR